MGFFDNIYDYYKKDGGSDAYWMNRISIPSLDKQIKKTKNPTKLAELRKERDRQIKVVKWASKKWPKYFEKDTLNF